MKLSSLYVMLMKYQEVNDISSLKKNLIFNLLLMLGALNLNIVLRPLKIAAGGINGVSIVVENIFKINPSFFILFFQLFLFLLSILFLGWKKSLSALYATIVYPLYVRLFLNATNYISISCKDIIVSCIFGGLVTGIVSGYICKLEKSPGGLVLLSQILENKFKIPISISNFIINFIIVLMTLYFFGINNFFYSILLLYVNKKVIERILI